MAQVALTDASSLSWDLSTQPIALLTATAGVGNTRTLLNSAISSGLDGENYQLTFIQDGVGSREVLFDTNYEVVGGFDPSPNKRTLITVIPQNGQADVILTPLIASSALEYTGLADTPSSYAGEGLKIVRVNAGETASEFVAVSALSFTESQISDLSHYTHPTGDGNLHVPANSTINDGKVLTASAVAGVYTWETPTTGVTDHTLLSNIGTNTHAQIDTHIADAAVHFTQAAISIPESQITSLSRLAKVSSNDTTAGYLEDKITTPNHGLDISILNEGGNEVIEIDLDHHQQSINSSALYSGGVLSAGTVGTFNLSAGSALHVDSATDFLNVATTHVDWTAFSNVAITNLATHPVSYILLSSAGAIVQLTSFPTPQQRRDNIFIGVVVHSDNATVNAVNNIPAIGIDVNGQVQDIMHSLGFFNLTGNRMSANGANLSINKSIGTAFKAGANWITNKKDPHTLSLAAQTLATFRYRNQDSTEGSDTTLIDPTTYDNGGTTTAIGGAANNSTIQRIYIFPSGIIRIQRGQEVFPTMAAAIDKVGKEVFVVETNIEENGLLLASLVVRNGATDLSNEGDAQFFTATKFGELGSVGSSSITSLQNAYNNSVVPSILTNSTLGAFIVQRGSALDTDNIFEGRNGAGSTVWSVSGNGDMYSAGAVVVDHTAIQSDEHGLELIVDAGGFGDVKALDIDYITGAIGAGVDEGIILVNIDETLAAGGEVFALEVLTTTLGSDKVIAVKTGVGIDAISQDTGVFGNADSILNKAVDVTAALASGGAGNITIFVADNDTVTVGSSTVFAEMEAIMDTGSSQNVQPTWEYSTGVGTWAPFTPTDGTNGFQNTGTMLWDDADLAGWAVGAGGEYLVRITRTRNNVTTAPIVDTIQVSDVTVYSWDKNGDLAVNNIVAAGTIGGSNLSGSNTGDQTSIVGISGTKAQFNTELSDGSFMFVGDAPTSHTLLGHTISGETTGHVLAADSATTYSIRQLLGSEISNTENWAADQTSIVGITGTKAQFNTELSDGTFMFVGDAPTAHTHLLAAGATDVTATAAELNLLDLAGLTAGWVLSADTATTASWKAPTGGSGDVATDTIWDAAGDLAKGTGSNTAARLPRGTANQVLTVNAGGTDIEWKDAAAGSGDVATDTIWDAAGDLAVGTGANTAAKLTKGNALDVLRVNAGGTALEWATNAAGATTLPGLSDVTSAAVTNKFVLVADGAAYVGRAMVVDDISDYPTSVEAYITDAPTQALLEGTGNWDIDGAYTGSAISGTFQGQKHYDTAYFFEAVDDNNWIRLPRG